ncbi:hypothetical protein HanPI659440_Chr02g0043061 [Helianthus annuus]|nr:hypothetical protein HanPI659440_Chr13g0483221 [Helianthus annuus]KAJ0733881.1 hypothetical protein HanPI659440_Chr11g0413461 [Helianthus annuus]KAJ0804871.1 hypothetical protein HanPI659440_Chr02g0043061 [Helianthus annuus]
MTTLAQPQPPPPTYHHTNRSSSPVKHHRQTPATKNSHTHPSSLSFYVSDRNPSRRPPVQRSSDLRFRSPPSSGDSPSVNFGYQQTK